MGDVAMTVPVLKLVLRQHSKLKITVVSKPFFEPLFSGIPNLTFVAADVKGKHKGVKGLYSLFKQLKETNITHVADLHNVLRSKIVRNFFRTSSVPVAYIDKGRAEKKELTKEGKKKIQQLKTTHQRYADVFTKLGFKVELDQLEKNQLPLSQPTQNLVGEKKTHWVGIAPFAAFEGKMYPLNLMKKALLELSNKGYQLFLFGGGEKEIQQLNELSSSISNTTVIAGKLKFTEELELISNLDLMISMDSGNGHLSSMFGVETITVWGVTHPYAGFAPFMQSSNNQLLPDLEKYPLLPCSVYGNKVFKGYERVMESISPEKILNKAIQTLQKKEL